MTRDEMAEKKTIRQHLLDFCTIDQLFLSFFLNVDALPTLTHIRPKRFSSLSVVTL
jgi:hypothetical protein